MLRRDKARIRRIFETQILKSVETRPESSGVTSKQRRLPSCRAVVGRVSVPKAFGIHRTEPAGAERHRRAGQTPIERERASQTPYNAKLNRSARHSSKRDRQSASTDRAVERKK